MTSSVEPLSRVSRQPVEEYLRDRVGLSRELIAWKYFDEAFNRDRERGFVLLRDGDVAGFVGVIPMEIGADGRDWPSAWICDWYCSVPGMGGFLFYEALRSFQYLAAFGAGTEYSRPALSGFSTVEYTDAGVVHVFPVRLAPVLRKIGKLAPWLHIEAWPGLNRLPLPAPRRTNLSHATRTETDEVGNRGVGRERLRTVEHVVIAIADVACGHRHGVGPEVRLGDRVGRDHVATADRGQVPAFLLLGAVEGQRQLNGPHLGVLGKDETIVSAGVTQGFHAKRVVVKSWPEPPYSVGTGRPTIPNSAHFFRSSRSNTSSASRSIIPSLRDFPNSRMLSHNVR